MRRSWQAILLARISGSTGLPATKNSVDQELRSALTLGQCPSRLSLTSKIFRQDSSLKTYRSPRELLDEVEKTLASNQPSFHHSPLDNVVETLCRGRHYCWMGIYLAVDQQTQQLLGSGGESGLGTALPETRSKILVSMKLAGRELGVLAVESDRELGFGSDDRVLLENVASVLARFLAGPGKYLVRKARETAAAAQSAPSRKPQSIAENPRASSAAVGEK